MNHDLKQYLKNRCATCIFWQGNREAVFNQITDLESFKDRDSLLKRYFTLEGTWCPDGICEKLQREIQLQSSDGTSPLVDAVFGCILYKSIES